jgi:hypothetical protein
MNINFQDKNDRKALLPIGLYYFVMLLISLSWSSMDFVEPNRIERYLFLLFFILPFFKFPYIAPPLITVFLSIRLFSVSPYGYLPSQINVYLLLALVLYFTNLQNKLLFQTNRFIIGLLIISVFSNLINLRTDTHVSSEFDFPKLLIMSLLLSKLIKNGFDVKLMEWSFVITTLCLSIYGLVFYQDFVANTIGIQDADRIYWNDPNYLGSVLSIGMIISFKNLMDFKNFKRLPLIIYILTFIFGLINLGMFASRGAFLALTIPFLYITYKRTNSVKTIVFTSLIFIGLILAFSNLSIFETIIDRFNDESLTTGSGRTVIWSKSFGYFLHSDIITLLFGGGGIFTHEIVGKATEGIYYSSHNNYLEILYDYGIVGLLFFIGMLVYWFKSNPNNIMAISLVLLLAISCMALSPLMYPTFWFLIILVEKQKVKDIEKF